MATAMWQFAEVEAVYQRLSPFTPYGRQALERRQVLTDPTELNRRYDRVELMTALLAASPETADQVCYHLKRIPTLPPIPDIATGADLFRVKKFLINCRALVGLLKPQDRAQFGLTWQSDELLKALDTGDGCQETFYLADRCSEQLAAVRAEIRQLEASLQALRTAALESLRVRHGLDFLHRDFLVMDHDQAARLGDDEAYLEPFDSRHVVVKPVLPKQHFEILAARETLLDRERQLEQGLLRELASAVARQESVLHAYVRAIESLDVALAVAKLARALDMTRPELLGPGTPLEVVGGRLIPLEEDCVRQGLEYRPLTAGLDTPHVLLHGSNMSGKSVVLKTVCALQLLAQLGLFVPARRFRTVVFDRLSFIGTMGTQEARGLSSFGQEIVDLRTALAGGGQVRLLVIDEFARTTNSREAAALIAGLLSFLDTTDHVYSFLATHYAGLPAFPHVRPWRMQGIDWEKLRRATDAQPTDDLVARVRAINRCVPYALVPGDGTQVSLDAIDIAAMLGLNEAIVEFARRQIRAGSGEAG